MDQDRKPDFPAMLAAIFSGYTMVYIDKMTIGIALVPIANELNLLPSEKGLVISIFFLGYTLFQVPMSYLNRKFDTRIILVFSITALGIFMALFGFVPSLVFILLLRFLSASVAHAPYPAAASRMITVHVDMRNRTFAQAALIGSAGFATFAGSFILSRVYQELGWRSGFFAVATVCAAVAVCLFFFLPPTKPEPESSQDEKARLPFTTILASPVVWAIMSSSFFVNGVTYGMLGFLPSYLTSERGLDLAVSGNIMALIGLASFIAALAGGYVIGKYLLGKEKQVIFIFSVIAAVLTYLIYLMDNLTLATLLLAVAYMLLMLSFITITSLPLKIFPKEVVAPYYATINAGGVLGGFFAPIVLGRLVELAGGAYLYAFMFLAAIAAISGICILFVSKSEISKFAPGGPVRRSV